MIMFRNNVIANFIGKVWPSLLGLVLVPVYLRYLGLEAYGLVGFFVSLQALISFLDLGLSAASNREVARNAVIDETGDMLGNLVRTFEVVYWSVAILIAAGFLLASNWLATQWVSSENISINVVRLAAVIFGLTLSLRWPVALYTGIMRGLEKQVLYNMVSAGVMTFRNIGAGLIVAYVSHTILAFLLWQLFSALIEVFVMTNLTWSLLPVKSNNKPVFHFEFIKKVGRFSLSLTLVSILASIFKQFDRIAITKFLSLEAVGYYSTAYVLYELLSYFVTPITDASFPRFSALLSRGDTDSLKEMYHRVAQTISFFVAPASMFLILFSKDVLLLWTHSQDVANQASFTLSVLAFAYMFNAMMHVPLMAQYAAGITFIAVGVNIFGVIFFLPLMYFMISRYGIAGAGITWLVYNILYYLVAPHFMHRHILQGEKAAWIFKDTLFFLASAWLFLGLPYFITSSLANRLYILLAVCLGALFYTLTCLLLYSSIRSLVPLVIASRFLPKKLREES